MTEGPLNPPKLYFYCRLCQRTHDEDRGDKISEDCLAVRPVTRDDYHYGPDEDDERHCHSCGYEHEDCICSPSERGEPI